MIPIHWLTASSPVAASPSLAVALRGLQGVVGDGRGSGGHLVSLDHPVWGEVPPLSRAAGVCGESTRGKPQSG